MSTSLALLLVSGINLVAFLVFWWDKKAARANRWRVQESTLLGLAAIGGSAGAVLAQQVLRHKTRKEPFRSTLRAIVFCQIVLGAAWLTLPIWSPYLNR